jgi:intracellular multiplication protein IcmV
MFRRTKKLTVGTVRNFFNIIRWSGYRDLKKQSKSLYYAIKPAYTVKEDVNPESFEEAKTRLGLSDDDLKERARALHQHSFFYVCASILATLYFFYLLYGLDLWAAFITILIAILTTIRYLHCRFWIYQIQNKRLGCSIGDWLSDDKKR